MEIMRTTEAEESVLDKHRQTVLRRLYIATTLCSVFLIIEVIGGYISGSLAVLSDAAHLLADLTAFAVAIGASHLAALPSSAQHTFGLKRTESLAALLSMVSLALVSIGLAFEAVRRLFFIAPEKVDGPLMSGIAAIGVFVNIVLAAVLGEHHVHLPGADDHHHHSHDHSHDHAHNHAHVETSPLVGAHHSDETSPRITQQQRNVNLQAAYIHVLGDLAQSVAVLIAGLTIWFRPNWHIVDPIATLFFCALVFYSTLSVIRSSIAILLEEVPPHIDWTRVHDAIESVPNVSGVHDLHIWSISQGIPSLSVHCFVDGDDSQQALKDIYAVCGEFGVQHATIQIQKLSYDEDCITCSPPGATNYKCVERK